ncbi:MAG: GNAT family N-acetyltransferase [Steroidobacteraceae bacterium]
MPTITSKRWTTAQDRRTVPAPGATLHSSIRQVDAAQWNAMVGGYPFLRHEFLAALERHGCVGGDTGWQPLILTLSDRAGICAGVAAYLKYHSYGEFVFDFAWAQAYHRHGLEYYPKLLIAAPFTPATGPRLLVRDTDAFELRAAELIAALQALQRQQQFSSIHALFLPEREQRAFAAAGWLARRDCQFHWQNRGYSSFEGYLETFSADKRKKARRERRRVSEAAIHFTTLSGSDASPAQLEQVHAMVRSTFLARGHEPYISLPCLREIAEHMGDALLIKLAWQNDEPVGTAIFFQDEHTLYGRYWGAREHFHSLHFETCYYQGIEHAIAAGLEHFDPGAQGEHKLSRGFDPVPTWSAHWIGDSRFRRAIADYLEQETVAVARYQQEAALHRPFRNP